MSKRIERQRAPIPEAAVVLTLERLVEVATIVRLRERIHRHQAIDLFVVVRLDVVAGHVLQDRATELHLVAVLRGLALHVRVVDERAVGRAEVLDDVALPVERDPRVMTADALLIDRKIRARRATDLEGRLPERRTLAELRTVDDDEARAVRARRDLVEAHHVDRRHAIVRRLDLV